MIHWKNTGDADVVAPVLLLRTSDGKTLLDPEWIKQEAMMVIASGSGYPGDVLPPGSSGSFAFENKFPRRTGTTTFTLDQVVEDNQPFDWSRAHAAFFPGDLPSLVPDFELAWEDVTEAGVGSTIDAVINAAREASKRQSEPVRFVDGVSNAVGNALDFHPVMVAAEPPVLPLIPNVSITPNALNQVHLGTGKTYVLIHGWNSDGTRMVSVALKILNDEPNATVLIYDWRTDASPTIPSRARAAKAGRRLAGLTRRDQRAHHVHHAQPRRSGGRSRRATAWWWSREVVPAHLARLASQIRRWSALALHHVAEVDRNQQPVVARRPGSHR